MFVNFTCTETCTFSSLTLKLKMLQNKIVLIA